MIAVLTTIDFKMTSHKKKHFYTTCIIPVFKIWTASENEFKILITSTIAQRDYKDCGY